MTNIKNINNTKASHLFVAQDFAMSDFSLILVLQIKTSVNRNKTWQI